MTDKVPLNLLLIEDDKCFALYFALAVADGQIFDYVLTVATRAADALKLLRGRTFEIIVLDLCLPDGEGLELEQTIRAASNDAPILIVTGRSDADPTVITLIERGCVVILKDAVSCHDDAVFVALRHAVAKHAAVRDCKPMAELLDTMAGRLIELDAVRDKLTQLFAAFRAIDRRPQTDLLTESAGATK